MTEQKYTYKYRFILMLKEGPIYEENLTAKQAKTLLKEIDLYKTKGARFALISKIKEKKECPKLKKKPKSLT